MIRFHAVLVALSLCFVVVAAAADEVDDKIAQADELMEDGEHERAIFLLGEAYQKRPTAVIAKKLAEAQEQRGGIDGLKGAIDSYRLYLGGDDKLPDREAIEAKTASLEKELAALENEKRQEEEDATKKVGKEDVGGFLAGPFPRVVLGLGFAASFASITAGVVALVVNNEAVDEPVHEDAQKLANTAEAFVVVANVAMAAGIVLSAAGTTMIVLDITLTPSDQGDARLQLTPTGVSLSTRF